MRITYYLNINDKFNNYSQFFEEKQYKHIKGVHFIQNLSLSNKHLTATINLMTLTIMRNKKLQCYIKRNTKYSKQVKYILPTLYTDLKWSFL